MISSALLVLIVAIGAIWAFRANSPESLADIPEAVHTFGTDTPATIEATINPPGNSFQDPVTATITIWVDATRVKPESITFERLDVAPYTPAAEFSRESETFGDAVRVTYTTALRCLKPECLSADGGPAVPQLKLVLVRYELLHETNKTTGNPQGKYLSAAWSPTAVLGRISPEVVLDPESGEKSYDPGLFDAAVVPPAPVFPWSDKALKTLVLVSAAAVAAGIVLLLNPNLRVLPEKVDPKTFIAQQQKAALAREAQKSPDDYVREALLLFSANTHSSDNVLYQLRNRLDEAGYTDLARSVERLNFGPDGDGRARDRLIRAIDETLAKKEEDHG